MAKRKRTQKLKVYSTPIGFHDALVAAPSQRAALEAWGAGTNLFSQGSAEIVTDPALTKVPLENPGQVVKVLRGSHAEQLEALDGQQRPKRKSKAKPVVLPKTAKPARRKPSRAALSRAESALEALKARQKEETERLEKEIRELENRRSDLERTHEHDLHNARRRVKEERETYQAARDRYEAG